MSVLEATPTVGRQPGGPVLSVVTLGAGRAPGGLADTLDSLTAMRDPDWEWLVLGPVGPVTTDGRVRHLPGRSDPLEDPAGALQEALSTARGEFLLVLAAGDQLADETVGIVRRSLHGGAWGYSDEVQVFGPGRSPDVWEKPEWAPEWALSQPYAARTTLLPVEALRAAGGFGQEAGTAAVWDAVLRLAPVRPPVRLPHPLVLRRDRDQRTRLVGAEPGDLTRVVEQHCARTGVAVESVEPVHVQGVLVGVRVRRVRSAVPAVSLVVPTRGSTSLVGGRPRCHVVEMVRSVWTESRWPDLEVVVVYDAVTPPEVLDELRSIVGADLVLVRYDDWFHFSRKCNLGAIAARGDLLCFLNDDTEVRTPDWLHEMVGRLEDPTVGAVGARLVFADGTLQHIGHHYGGGYAGHPLFGWRPSTLALGGAAHVAGERVGVTAACVLLRTSDFLAVGGFSEAFPLNYNDVDLCLKLREVGFRLVYTPHAELHHYESQTRVATVLASELQQVRTRWTTRMRSDPYLPLSRPHRLRSKFQSSPQAQGPAALTIPVLDPDGSPEDVVSDLAPHSAVATAHEETHV